MLKENCHFYTEYPDMGGRIPCCTRYTQLGKCPCDNCNRFLDKVDAQKIIKKYSDGELISLDIIKEIRQEIDQMADYYYCRGGELEKEDFLKIIDRKLNELTNERSDKE